jgi:hypothetical protein
MGGGEHCTGRSKTWTGCNECCSLQRAEAEECHCLDDYCNELQPYIERKCKEDCIGKYAE